MKKLVLMLFTVASIAAIAQPKGKEPKMAAVFTKGYYVGLKGDTVKGEVAVNTEDITQMYKGFSFRTNPAGKAMPISTKKAKSYGYDGKHFTIIPFDGGEVYIEYLAKGRLSLMEFKYNGKVDGYPGIESAYFIQDTRPTDEKNAAELKEFKQFGTKFYKKEIKDYFKDQPGIHSDLDKYTFNLNALIKAVNEFNKFYEVTE